MDYIETVNFDADREIGLNVQLELWDLSALQKRYSSN